MSFETMNTPSIYIIILNWNQYDLTKDCLLSLKDCRYDNYEIVVVDNGSIDGSADRIRQEFSNVIVIQNKTNLGFSGGNNTGIEYALKRNANYIYLLNNDTEVHPDFLNKAREVIDVQKNTVIVGSTCFYYDDPNIVWFSGGKMNWNTGDVIDPRAGLPLPKNNNESELVDEVAGAGMLVDASFLKLFGSLDEKFFIYFEETDLCRRAINQGYDVRWCSESKIWHKVSKTFGETSLIMEYFMLRNRIYFMKKHNKRFHVFLLRIMVRVFLRLIKSLKTMDLYLARTLVLSFSDYTRNNMYSGNMEKIIKWSLRR